jgi:hypothetical protein
MPGRLVDRLGVADVNVHRSSCGRGADSRSFVGYR